MAGSRLFSSDMSVVTQVQIPYLPAKVALEDLSDDGCLLSHDQLELLNKYIPNLIEERRYTKQEISKLMGVNWPYSLIHHEGRFYAIYKGAKHGKHLGQGKYGKVKLAQCLEDKRFYALKLQADQEATNKEFEMLSRVRETPQTRALASRQCTTTGENQSMILMKLAHGQGIDQLTDQEIDASYTDEDGNQVIRGLMSPILRIQLALDTLIKLDKLHLARHVIHRDLQPGNIMLDLVEQQARLIDYGQATAAQVSGPKLSSSERSLKGSTRNYSPQLRRHLRQIQKAMSANDAEMMPNVTYDRASEMYGIGITMAAFFHLLDPIPDVLEHKPHKWGSHLIEDAVAEACLPHYRILPMELYRSVLALVRRMVEEDEDKRIRFSEAISELMAMRDKLIQAGEKVSVALLDIVNIDSSNPDAMCASIQALGDAILQSGVDEVCLVDSSGKQKSILELLTIQRQLQEVGLRVGNVCFTGLNLKRIEMDVANNLATRPVPSQLLRCSSVGQTLAAAAAAAASSLSSSSSSSSSPLSSLSSSSTPLPSSPATMTHKK